MKLFFDCSMGASGDMLMAALYELLPDRGVFCERMERLGLPGVSLDYSDCVKCGIKGTHITVKVSGVEEISEDAGDQRTVYSVQCTVSEGHEDEHGHEHHHHHVHAAPHERREQSPRPTTLNSQPSTLNSHHGHGFDEILDFIRSLDLPESVSNNALGVFTILGEAEAAVHGTSLDSVHLHEVGSLDAVADIVGCCLLMDMLGVTEVFASPVHVGSGSVRCEHGILPVPAPAAAEILKGIPIYGGQIRGELCTPTGAALLKRFVTRFGNMPLITPVKIGYGMGKKDFEAANCLRVFLFGDRDSGDAACSARVCEISCNLDDMTPEAVGAAFGILFDNGALDVYATPITMKKSRPAVMLSCLCAEEKREALALLMLQHTTTLGVRMALYDRMVLERDVVTVATEYGDIRVKRAEGFGVIKNMPEYEDVLAAATLHGVSFMTVYNAAVSLARCSSEAEK